MSITIHPVIGAVVGDKAAVRASVPVGGQVEGAVASHQGTAHKLDLTRRGRTDVMGEFVPDSPGRWWVSVRHQGVTAEACFWVNARRVQF